MGNELSLAGFSLGFFSPSRKIPGEHLIFGHDHFHTFYNSLPTPVSEVTRNQIVRPMFLIVLNVRSVFALLR